MDNPKVLVVEHVRKNSGGEKNANWFVVEHGIDNVEEWVYLPRLVGVRVTSSRWVPNTDSWDIATIFIMDSGVEIKSVLNEFGYNDLVSKLGVDARKMDTSR